MTTQFEPLCLGNIDQGLFVEEAERQFRKLQDDMIRHIRQHGDESTSRLTLGIELKHKQGAVFVTTSIDKKLPGIPKTTTNTMIDQTQDLDEQLCLFTAVGGSHSDPPAQQQLCKRDGTPLAVDTLNDTW